MNERDVFFRAFHEFKKSIQTEKSINRLCDYLLNAQTDDDNLETERTYCIIEEDWIKIIEEGMVYVEKAIKEERQFIRKQGEVVPIEKLRHVSTDTVTHLARHSELITKEPEEGETLTPEKLFMVENLSDMAVYENRFIYMLLCYTRDFIGARLDKIIELGRTFKMKGKTVKHIKMGAKRLVFVSDLTFEDKNDPLSKNYSDANGLIERIETMQRLTISLLGTPLMREVSKTPMIKPPITRTNVLRMNNNFKNALEMYCKLSEYNKDGYSIEKMKSSMRPFCEELLKEQVAIIALQQFLYYKYGNKLSEELWKEFLLEEERIKQREKQALKEQAERLKRKIKETGKGHEEYILVLEKRMEDYDAISSELAVLKAKVESFNKKLEEIQALYNGEKEKSLSLFNELKRKEQEYKNSLENLEREYSETIERKTREFNLALENKENEIKELVEKYEREKTQIINEFTEKLSALEKQKTEEYQALLTKSVALTEKLNADLKEKDNLLAIFKAQLHGLRTQYGLIGEEDDFTSRERFSELEKEYEALKDLLKNQWQKTKKKIRKDILGKNQENVAITEDVSNKTKEKVK